MQGTFALPSEIGPDDPKLAGCGLDQTLKHCPVEKTGVQAQNDWQIGFTRVFNPQCRAIDLNVFTVRIGDF
ncbi:hypothetical protein D3C75_1129890 [compost metagenome]